MGVRPKLCTVMRSPYSTAKSEFRIPKIMKSINVRELVARQNENERKIIFSEPIKGKAKACKTYTAE